MSRSSPGRLTRLDDRALPALASALRGLAAGVRVAGRATGPVGRWVVGFSRRQPTVAAAVVIVAAAAVLWAATGGNHPKSVRPVESAVVPPLSDGQLGPSAGSSVADYLAAAALRRQQLAALPSTQRLDAVVDLTGYLSPQAISTLLAGEPAVQIERGFAQVAPPATAAVHVLTVGVGGDLASQLSQDQAQAQQLLSRYNLAVRAAALHPSSLRIQQLVAAQQPQVPTARVDAKGLGATCGCVFALVVSGPVGQLERIAGLTDVRVLDPAPPSTPVDQLMVVPLEPQTTGTIQPLQFAGD